MPANAQDLTNRIRKMHHQLRKWAGQNGFEAYRVYDRDIPEFPYIVDVYRDHAVVYDKSNPNWEQSLKPDEVTDAVATALGIPPNRMHWKTRARQKGKNQYERLEQSNERLDIAEGALHFQVNLSDFLDTGLFLDHRPLRQAISRLPGSGLTCLNLFCYTGSLSVAAAKAGFEVTSIDMSATYLNWARDNFRRNDLRIDAHHFIQADATNPPDMGTWGASPLSFDLICIDPPTFSNSKRMAGTFDVQRDHGALLAAYARYLAPGGVLVFSCNRRDFKIDPDIPGLTYWRNVSSASIPKDFRDVKIHTCHLLHRPGETPHLGLLD